MNRRELQRSMYQLRGASIMQRVTLAVLAGVCVLLAWWMLADGGLRVVGSWLGLHWRPGDQARRFTLAAGFSIYYVRILFTEFVFLKRGVGWTEVWTIAPWVLIIFLLLAIAGGTNRTPVGVTVWAGSALFVLGSWMNSYAEYARGVWKQGSRNHGRLYTDGLFQIFAASELSRRPALVLGAVPGFGGVGDRNNSIAHAGWICVHQHPVARRSPARPLWQRIRRVRAAHSKADPVCLLMLLSRGWKELIGGRSVCGGFLGSVNDQYFGRSLRAHQTQAELLLQSREQRWSIRPRLRLKYPVVAQAGREVQNEIIAPV